jgi:hypothetical protein
MTRIITLTALVALGLSGAPVHEPVHAWRQAIAMTVTQRDTIKIRRTVLGAPGSTRGSLPVAARHAADLPGRRDEPASIFSSPSSAVKHDAESKRGRHSQSTEPLRPTKADVCRSPISA